MTSHRFLLAMSLSVPAAPCAADTLVVSPRQSIQAAIATASAGDVVLVMPGLYVETIDFLGKGITVRGGEGPGATIIDGNGSGSVVRFTQGEGAGSVLEGFTIKGGTGAPPLSRGGGIYIVSASPTVRNCTITGNTALTGGGAYAQASTATFSRCTFQGNAAPPGVTNQGGAALANAGGGPLIVNCLFIENDAGAALGDGGALFNASSSPRITNCLFDSNLTLKGTGGAIYSEGSGTITVTSSTFWGNESSQAGAIQGEDHTTTLVNNCIIWGNIGQSFGACAASEQICTVGSSASVIVADSIVDGGWPGALDADPLFANPGEGNFRVVPLSPGRDSGENALLPADPADIDGDGDVLESLPLDLGDGLRVIAKIVDMGAYELCLGDLDGDGEVEVPDLTALILAWGECPAPCPADLDSDGDIDIGDLVQMILTWGLCGSAGKG